MPFTLLKKLILKGIIRYFCVALNYNIIMENLIRNAKLGDIDSQFELGVKYFFGTDTIQDYSQAFIWFQKAAQQGHGTAQYNLAQCYEKELGTSQDYSLAFYWYQKSAAQGDVDAMSNVALYYYLGRGINRDYEEAVLWWRKAASLENEKACFNLGICYRDGTGVWKDLDEAEKWILKAEELGHPKASQTLQQIKRLLSAKYEVKNERLDLLLKSTHHQRYQNGIPVMGSQYCNRQIKIEHKIFKDMFNGLDVNSKEGFLISMWNTDVEPPTQHMQPKLMEMMFDTGDTIMLRGVQLQAMGVVAYDNRDYGMTLYLRNRNVVKCVLHMYDRGVDIEYDEFIN